MNMYGKKIPFPRLTSWYGDNDKPYSFSGITLEPHPWIPGLSNIKSDIESKAKVIFNSVLLNRYRDGNDSISWHTDAEKELGKNPVIASVNFGAERKFQLKHIKTNEKIEIIFLNIFEDFDKEFRKEYDHQIHEKGKVSTDKEKYAGFFEQYGRLIKEGVCFARRAILIKTT